MTLTQTTTVKLLVLFFSLCLHACSIKSETDLSKVAENAPTLNEATQNRAFEFALIGDLPYGVKKGEFSKDTSQLIDTLNSQDLAWVLHIGDIKKSISACSNDFLQDRYQRFSRIRHPFVYTPGDNEWTDCHTQFAGGFDPFDRLRFLRKLFFEGEKRKNTEATLNILTQAQQQPKHTDFIENSYWIKNNIHFATIHIVGSLDGNAKFTMLSAIRRSDKHDEEVVTRQTATIEWLRFVFSQAREAEAKGLFIAIHANPAWETKRKKKTKKAFEFFNDALEKELKNFNKPVVVAHGDTHTFRIDHPSLDGKTQAPSNFTRVETFGENNKAWIKVKVDQSSDAVFSFEAFD